VFRIQSHAAQGTTKVPKQVCPSTGQEAGPAEAMGTVHASQLQVRLQRQLFAHTCRFSKVTPFIDQARLLNVDGIIVLKDL
jgi:hypothetical protein